MIKRAATLGLMVLAMPGIAALSGCGEKTQAPGAKGVDAQAFQGTPNPYAMSGWTAGDRASWEAQMRSRTQNQNEYTRIK